LVTQIIKLNMFYTHTFLKIGDYEEEASCIGANTVTAAAAAVEARE
jgi:hypothetical protein